jgi:hypothetical protein
VIDACDGGRLRVNGLWVTTMDLETYILGWTSDTPEDQMLFGSPKTMAPLVLRKSS